MSAEAYTRRDFLAHGILGAVSGTLGGRFFPQDPGVARIPARAKRLVHLHFAGGPPQMDLFDPKPALDRWDGKPCPKELLGSQKFAFIKGHPKILGTRHPFARYGQSGRALSTLLPRLGEVVDDLCFVHSMHTDEFNHAPAQLFLLTGHARFGRPSLGSWLSYGFGDGGRDLPTFVVLVTGDRNPDAGKACWGSGFLPSVHQGVQFRSGNGDPVLYVNDPPGIDRTLRRDFLDAIRTLGRDSHAREGDPETPTRLAQWDMAHRMQTSAPEVADLRRESAETLALYGVEPGKPSFAANCLLARRLLERGVPVVELFDWGWDIHGTSTSDDLMTQLPAKCRDTDRAAAALVADLKRRGMLDDTLVLCTGEFGRTAMNEERDGSKFFGRDHNPNAFTVWMAGGGTKRGFAFGETDELGSKVVRDPVHVRDLQATVLHLLGFDHTRLTWPYAGRDFRLTDTGGRVVRELLA